MSFSCIVRFSEGFILSYMFMQPLSNRHSCCHQQLPSHQTDKHENQTGIMPVPSTSSQCSSQCTDSCKKSSLSPPQSQPSSSQSPSPLSSAVKYMNHPKNKQTTLSYEKPTQLNNYHDSIVVNNCIVSTASTVETKRVHFIDSTTSSEPSSLSLLFEQTTHISDPLRSNHVINALFSIIPLIIYYYFSRY